MQTPTPEGEVEVHTRDHCAIAELASDPSLTGQIQTTDLPGRPGNYGINRDRFLR